MTKERSKKMVFCEDCVWFSNACRTCEVCRHKNNIEYSYGKPTYKAPAAQYVRFIESPSDHNAHNSCPDFDSLAIRWLIKAGLLLGGGAILVAAVIYKLL